MLGFSLRAEMSRFLADQNGATAIEYALIASGVSVAIVTAVWSVGTSVKDTLYGKIAQALNN